MAEYEFSEEDNKTFDLLSGALRRFALTFAAFAVLLALMGIIWIATGMPRPAPDSSAGVDASWLIIVVYVGIPATAALAVMFLKPLENLKRITTTEGQDISELLAALDDLNQSFGLLRIFVAVLFIVMITRVAMLFF